ncbi:hypothetical protein HNR46_001312 [Haloferula luteola]|uniref:ParB/Sulfiredoxin domain-containing protein n=1 Tax=Haloferula luteola TaxID=595692 RepID=A0A840V8M8_9BACT|nr:ParB/Srx family N-terminal domain-containing protein [Haloferula luteola]MBB5351078.1 hypothetical protein [Haloferula luteola]
MKYGEHFMGELIPHPMLERITMLPDLAARETRLGKESGKDRAGHREKAEELSTEWAAFCEDIREHGIREPLKICPIPEKEKKSLPGRITHWIVDGRHRWQASLDTGIAFASCVIVSLEEAADIILSAVTRRHFSKGSLAYMSVLTCPEVAMGGAKRKASTQFKTGPALSAGPVEASAMTAEALSKRVGVSLRIMEQACELYRELDGFPALAREAEASVFSGSGLGAVCGWVKGEKTQGGEGAVAARPKKEPNYNHLATSSLVTLGNVAKAWPQLEEHRRADVIKGLREVLHTLPPAVRHAILS